MAEMAERNPAIGKVTAVIKQLSEGERIYAHALPALLIPEQGEDTLCATSCVFMYNNMDVAFGCAEAGRPAEQRADLVLQRTASLKREKVNRCFMVMGPAEAGGKGQRT
jgi:hypothetical protein